MTRDHADLDAALSPLASRGASAGFAGRLAARYAQAVAARRRRAALLWCAASCSGLALICLTILGLIRAFPVSLHGWLTAGLDGVTTVTAVLAHAAVHPLVHDFPEFAASMVALAAMTAVCCVALAAIVRSSPVSSRAH